MREPGGAGMDAPRSPALEQEVFGERANEGATAEATKPPRTRCGAVLKNGEQCKRVGQPTFDGLSGRYLYYCLAHRRLLRAKGRLHSAEL